MLIHKDPVAGIKIKEDGKIEITHYTDGKDKPCIYCNQTTKNRKLGSPVCKSCFEFGYSKCKKCTYGFRASTFHCNGNDLEDHFTHYTACAMHDYMGNLRKTPNFKEKPSVWHVSPIERKKCFKKRVDKK
jgi:hypothetical protein